MVSWNKICKPKNLGGLGLRKIEVVNSSFLSKLTWKLFNHKCLWTEQMWAKYPVNETFFMAKPHPPDSWVWKCILQNRDQFHKGIRWKVGDGEHIKFWTDSGCDNRSMAALMGIADTFILNTSLTVAQFIQPSKGWDIGKLQGIVNSACLKAILEKHIPSNPIPDSIC